MKTTQLLLACVALSAVSCSVAEDPRRLATATAPRAIARLADNSPGAELATRRVPVIQSTKGAIKAYPLNCLYEVAENGYPFYAGASECGCKVCGDPIQNWTHCGCSIPMGGGLYYCKTEDFYCGAP